MTDISTAGVVGIDGHVPVYQPGARWCWWSIDELYVGQEGEGKYVPKLNDYVIEPLTFTTWRVVHIDPVTLIARLQQVRPANMTFDLTEADRLFGIGPGAAPNTFRVYLDTTTLPHTLSVDSRCYIPGTDPHHAKLFRGIDLTDTGDVISCQYDASGNPISDQIPLETVALDSHTNVAIRIAAVSYTNQMLPDGELVTLVVYGVEGQVVQKQQLLIENTSFIRSANAPQHAVSHIGLESPFIAPTDDHRIVFPLNVPLNALNLTGVVYYTDGRVIRYPVNGSRFTLFGINQFVSTIVGQRMDLVLNYVLAPDEVSQHVPAPESRCLTEPYSLVVSDPNHSLNVKLFGYPVWIDAANGYQMRWYLLNLDRTLVFDVTQHVRFAENTGPFDPKGYGYLQRKAVIINLRDVTESFLPFLHTQLVDISLLREPNGRVTPWTVAHEAIGGRPSYGTNSWAIRLPGLRRIQIDCGLLTQTEWINQLYLTTYPLIERTTETQAPLPTHFLLSYTGGSSEHTLSEWNTELSTAVELPLHSTVFLQFFKRYGSVDLNLAIAALVVVE